MASGQVEKEEKTIQKKYKSVIRSMDSLYELILRLEERLEPVMIPSTPKTKDGEKDLAEQHSELYKDFSILQWKIHVSHGVVADILSRLEI